MYGIALFKPGQPRIVVGGEINTLSLALMKLDSLRLVLNAAETEGTVGIKVNIDGAPCQLLVVDRLGFPIRDAQQEEE